MSLLGNRGRFTSDNREIILNTELKSELSLIAVNPNSIFKSNSSENNDYLSIKERIDKADISANLDKLNSEHLQYNNKIISADKKISNEYSKFKKNKINRADFKAHKVGIKTIIAMIIVEILTIIGIISLASVVRLSSMTQVVPFDPRVVVSPYIDENTIQLMKGYKTVAVFGVDSRNGSVSQGNNADVNLLVNLNIENGDVQLISIYRDLYLNVTDNNIYDKINSAYRRGGPEAVVKALNKNLDLNIVNFFAFNWKAVATGIQLIDGIDMEISKSEFKYINAFIHETCIATGIDDKNPAAHYIKSPGFQHLDGIQAVAYGRLRLMDSDFQRVERQKKVVMLCLQKAKKLDLPTLRLILESVLPQIAYEFDMNEMVSLLRIIRNVNVVNSTSCPDASNVIAMDMGACGTCVVPLNLEKAVVNLHKILFNNDDYKISSAVKRYSNRINELRHKYQEENERKALLTDENGENGDSANISVSTSSNTVKKQKKNVSTKSNINTRTENDDANYEEEPENDAEIIDSNGNEVNETNETSLINNSQNETGAVVVEGPPGSVNERITETKITIDPPISNNNLNENINDNQNIAIENSIIETTKINEISVEGPIANDNIVEPNIVIP